MKMLKSWLRLSEWLQWLWGTWSQHEVGEFLLGGWRLVAGLLVAMGRDWWALATVLKHSEWWWGLLSVFLSCSRSMKWLLTCISISESRVILVFFALRSEAQSVSGDFGLHVLPITVFFNGGYDLPAFWLGHTALRHWTSWEIVEIQDTLLVTFLVLD